ncbi:MAG TPA: hypothetical protein PLD25_31985 [Chloroflexota bacterium]|nr:hypothetical protein [Chloroflexota bacterium]HUM67555.1 hypothetical protein [Chloroflexota bacterium]
MISDTHPETEKVLVQLLQQTPVWRKLEMMGELNRTARSLAFEGLREQYPAATEAELKRRLADLLLGPELARQVYSSLMT